MRRVIARFWQVAATEVGWCSAAQLRSGGGIWQRVRSERCECLGAGISTPMDHTRSENVRNGHADCFGAMGKPPVATAGRV